MAKTWTITKLEIVGAAKRAVVEHTLPDGTVVVREYGWPATLTKAGMVATLDDLHAKLLAEPPTPASYDESLDLVGVPRNPEAVTDAIEPPAESSPASGS